MSKVHQHFLGEGFTNSSPTADDVVVLEDWFYRLVAAIDMNILVEPKAIWCEEDGNEGLTGLVVLTTSHSSIHFWRGFFKFDLYSCKEYDTEIVIDMLKELDICRLTYKVEDRSGVHSTTIETGDLTFTESENIWARKQHVRHTPQRVNDVT